MLLIISKSGRLARSISETFHYMSILSYAATPHEGLSEISGLYRAVLIIDPKSLPDAKDYVFRLKSYNQNVPIFALCECRAEGMYPDIFDAVFVKPTFTPLLAEKIIESTRGYEGSEIGRYYLAGFDASRDTYGVNYFFTPLGFTKTEAMIIRYLIRSYPLPQSAKAIIKYAFKPTRSPEPSSIRTHISLMNKKLLRLTGNRHIVHIKGKGYVILTPEYTKYYSNL